MATSYTFTWLKEWGSDLLSPWAYFQRFQLANVINHRDLLELVQAEWLPPHIVSIDKSDFVAFPVLDDRKVRDIFGVSLMEETVSFITRFIRDFKNVSKYYPKRILHTCPICMTYGYHSQLHQIKGIDYCAFHNVPLQNCCPKCGRTHSYRFNDTGFQSPFICECGHCFMNGLETGIWRLDLWKCHHDWTIRNVHVLTMESMAQLYQINPRDRNQVEPRWLDYETVNMTRKLYKAFLRRMRRQMNRRGERGAVRQMRNNSTMFSAHAYAYIKTKMFAEHLQYYTMVDAMERNLIDDLRQGLVSDTSPFFRLYRATLQHFPPVDETVQTRNMVHRILCDGLILILLRRYMHYLQEGNSLVLKSRDERINALQRREYKRPYRRKRRDSNGTLLEHSRLNSRETTKQHTEPYVWN